MTQRLESQQPDWSIIWWAQKFINFNFIGQAGLYPNRDLPRRFFEVFALQKRFSDVQQGEKGRWKFVFTLPIRATNISQDAITHLQPEQKVTWGLVRNISGIIQVQFLKILLGFVYTAKFLVSLFHHFLPSF